jgi:UDP-GlcNAc:undecaprenyl-phosphate GlcNAc-1-phosphate transferase
VRRFAIRRKLFDIPNNRSSHPVPIPRIGGIAILFSFLFVCILASIVSSCVLPLIPVDVSNTIVVLSGGIFISLVGLYDDINGMSPWRKLGLQVIVAVYAVSLGLKIDLSAFLVNTYLAPYSVAISSVVSVIWIVSIINAVNLMDGLDGLAGGICIIAMSALFVLLYVAGSLVSPIIALALIGSVLGFLYHNYHPANIFMGDTGSLFLGFVLATFPLPLSVTTGNSFGIWLIPLCVLYLPIFDMISCFIRRVCEGRSPFSADKKHLHHRIYLKHCNGNRRSYRKTVHRLYGIAVVFTLLSVVPFMQFKFCNLLVVFGVLAMTVNLMIRYHYLDPVFEAVRAKQKNVCKPVVPISKNVVHHVVRNQRSVSDVREKEPVSV